MCPGRARRGRAALLAGLAGACSVLLFAVTVDAHELRPAYLELREERPSEFGVLWKVPARGEMRLALCPEFSGRSELLAPIVTHHTDAASVETWRFRAVEPLRGQTLRIRGLEATMTDALVRMEFADGTTWTERLTPGRPSVAVPARQSGWGVAGQYLRLGVEHILSGFDHLLFVLSLLLITGVGWRLVATVSAFTVSHSITLTAATLGFVRVPQRPVEAVIALSIVFVAAEIVRRDRGRDGVAVRAPWVVAFTFGLLHGLGFAGGLSEAGLPAGHIPTALLFFSAGVEAGHLLFVGSVVSLITLCRRVDWPLPRWVALAPAYAIGSVAMFWVMQRVAAF
jgi:hydrogenase/urease accessory protein HupE